MSHHFTAFRMKACAGILAGLAASLLLVACGADQVAGIQGSGAPVASGVTSVGTVTGFGSVFVDGVEYGTSSAQIRLDDQAGTESQLRVGQIVTVRGTLDASGNAGTAAEITFVSDVKGPIGQVNLAARTFTVLSQTVRVTDATLFDESIRPAELATLNAGAAVQVSGFVNSAGEIVASRIDPTSSAELQLKGTAQSLDTTARTFRINTLTIDYSAATVTGTLANASPVIVRANAVNPSGVLVATRVQVVGGTGAAANDNGRVEGLVTSFTSNADFAVNGLRVVTDSSTQFALQGLTLGVDLPVKVRGTFNANGALLAARVEARQNNSGLIRGLVDAVSSANNTLTVLGVAVTTTSTTSFEDRSEQRIRQFRLSDVRVGDYVEVRGVAGASGSGLSATLVERDRPEERSYVQGVPRNVADPNFTVLGLQVMTNQQTRFAGPGGQARGREQFFNQPGTDLVTVRGTVTGGILVADQVHVRN
jgi:hypothetical protein